MARKRKVTHEKPKPTVIAAFKKEAKPAKEPYGAVKASIQDSGHYAQIPQEENLDK